MTGAATASADRVSQRTLANPRRRLWAPSLVIGLTLLTYLPVCWAGFTVWDDQNILYRNTSLTPPTAQSLEPGGPRRISGFIRPSRTRSGGRSPGSPRGRPTPPIRSHSTRTSFMSPTY